MRAVQCGQVAVHACYYTCNSPSPLVTEPCIVCVIQIRTIERVCEIPHEGPFCDLMWSDPEETETWAISPRGAGWLFGARVATEFNQINGLELICRAHQLVQEGLKYMFAPVRPPAPPLLPPVASPTTRSQWHQPSWLRYDSTDCCSGIVEPGYFSFVSFLHQTATSHTSEVFIRRSEKGN